MPLVYDPAGNGPLRQGEILGNVIELRVVPGMSEEGDAALVRREHPLVIILTADCDLMWDFRARFHQLESVGAPMPVEQEEAHKSTVPYVLLCDLYDGDAVKTRSDLKSDQWRRVQNNQDERYHHLNAAGIQGSNRQVGDLYLDFKKPVSLPLAVLYEQVRAGQVSRVAIVPHTYVHDLTHRFFGFLSRVGTPD